MVYVYTSMKESMVTFLLVPTYIFHDEKTYLVFQMFVDISYIQQIITELSVNNSCVWKYVKN